MPCLGQKPGKFLCFLLPVLEYTRCTSEKQNIALHAIGILSFAIHESIIECGSYYEVHNDKRDDDTSDHHVLCFYYLGLYRLIYIVFFCFLGYSSDFDDNN